MNNDPHPSPSSSVFSRITADTDNPRDNDEDFGIRKAGDLTMRSGGKTTPGGANNPESFEDNDEYASTPPQTIVSGRRAGKRSA